MRQFKVQVVYALPPQVKGKVERPYCRISLDRHSIKVPTVEVREEADLYTDQYNGRISLLNDFYGDESLDDKSEQNECGDERLAQNSSAIAILFPSAG
jgi:hypothetical protein